MKTPKSVSLQSQLFRSTARTLCYVELTIVQTCNTGHVVLTFVYERAYLRAQRDNPPHTKEMSESCHIGCVQPNFPVHKKHANSFFIPLSDQGHGIRDLPIELCGHFNNACPNNRATTLALNDNLMMPHRKLIFFTKSAHTIMQPPLRSERRREFNYAHAN